MKYLTVLISALLLLQCVNRQSENSGVSSKAISVALDAYLWGAFLVENRRVVNLNEIRSLYGSSANWADKKMRAKIAKVGQKLENYNPSNGADRDQILFIFDGNLPMSRDMSNVTQPMALRRDTYWEVVIEGIRSKGVQWKVYDQKRSYTFEVIEERGVLLVKDVIIAEGGFRRRLSQWLDAMAK